MLKFEKYKKILKAGDKKYSDDDVRKIIEALHEMATMVDDVRTIENEKLEK